MSRRRCVIDLPEETDEGEAKDGLDVGGVEGLETDEETDCGFADVSRLVAQGMAERLNVLRLREMLVERRRDRAERRLSNLAVCFVSSVAPSRRTLIDERKTEERHEHLLDELERVGALGGHDGVAREDETARPRRLHAHARLGVRQVRHDRDADELGQAVSR